MSTFRIKNVHAPSDRRSILQANIQLFTNINTVIWQQLAATIAIQSGAIISSYATRPSVLSVVIMLLGFCVTCALMWQIKGNMEQRAELGRQANYIVEQFLVDFLAERTVPKAIPTPFKLFNEGLHRRYGMVRDIKGVYILWGSLFLIDVGATVIFNAADHISQFLPAGLPLFKAQLGQDWQIQL